MAKKTNTNFIVRLVVGFILVVLVFAAINIQISLNELKENKENIEKQIEAAKDVVDELNIRLDTPVTDEYIERVAREELGYRREGEIIFYNDLAN